MDAETINETIHETDTVEETEPVETAAPERSVAAPGVGETVLSVARGPAMAAPCAKT